MKISWAVFERYAPYQLANGPAGQDLDSVNENGNFLSQTDIKKGSCEHRHKKKKKRKKHLLYCLICYFLWISCDNIGTFPQRYKLLPSGHKLLVQVYISAIHFPCDNMENRLHMLQVGPLYLEHLGILPGGAWGPLQWSGHQGCEPSISICGMSGPGQQLISSWF